MPSAHITGGGLTENIPRVLPANTLAHINRKSWSPPAIFQWLQRTGNVDDTEMLKTFNCGIGMAVIVEAADADAVIATLKAAGEQAMPIGTIETTDGDSRVTYDVS